MHDDHVIRKRRVDEILMRTTTKEKTERIEYESSDSSSEETNLDWVKQKENSSFCFRKGPLGKGMTKSYTY